jgi:hypothetical protein
LTVSKGTRCNTVLMWHMVEKDQELFVTKNIHDKQELTRMKR